MDRDSSDEDLLLLDKIKVKRFLYALDPEEYIDFMKDVHFHCPFKTKELTDEIVHHWNNDLSMESHLFNEILEERELERKQEAKGRRLQSLMRIQDMNSSTGLQPLELFPKEIWIMLFEKLAPEEKHNFRAMHETFCDITEDNLIGDILLPMTLNFKMDPFWDERTNAPKSPSPLAHFTQLRLVCKSLRNAVDRWFEDDLVSKLHTGDKDACPSKMVHINLLDIADLEKFARMKAHLNTSPKNKIFFTRSLRIVSPEEDENTEAEREQLRHFSQTINEILNHVGEQIWCFSFEFSRPSYFWSNERPLSTFPERYTSFLGWLSRMPNLKWLKLTINEEERDSRIQNYSNLRGSSPPPQLIYLERLDLELKQPNRYIDPLYVDLLAANSHAKVLNLIGLKHILKQGNGFVASGSDPAKTPLVLDVLGIHGPTLSSSDYSTYSSDSEEDDDHGDDDFDDAILFTSILTTNWPLKSLDCELTLDNIYVDSLFQVLENFQTLEKLRISVEDIIIRNDVPFLRLPNLEHFELKMKKSLIDSPDGNWSLFFTLQFLLFAKKLKTLVWECDMGEKCWEKVREDFMGIDHLGKMVEFGWVLCDLLGFTEMCDVESYDIWRVFPKLDTVLLELRIRNDKIDAVKKSISEKFLRRQLDFLGIIGHVYPSSSSSSESLP